MRSLFAQEMVERGIIMPYIAISNSHNDQNLEYTLNAVKESRDILKLALEGDLTHYLRTHVIKPVFRKYN